jgi:predicted site-specific integrase-resolvase
MVAIIWDHATSPRRVRLTKVKHLAEEAQALHATNLWDFSADKRLALLVCLIQSAQISTRDEILQMFIKRMSRITTRAKEELERARTEERGMAEHLVEVFADVLEVAADSEDPAKTMGAIAEVLEREGGTAKLHEQCEQVSAHHGDRYQPFVLMDNINNRWRENLERQVERLTHYCTTRGYQVAQVVKEIASGVNESRPKLLSLLKDQQATRIVVEHKDRLTRFGFRYLETLLEIQGRTIEVVNVAENDKEDLIADLVAIVYSFTARLYGQRRAKRKTERLVQELQAEEKEQA